MATQVAELIQIREVEMQRFRGEFPTIENYSHVNVEMLTEGDPNPCFVVLRILQRERVSRNGLLYDNELVDRILAQLSEGTGGIMGHLGIGEEMKYPVDAVNWVGHLEENGVIWGKAYVGVSELRDHLRRKIASGGRIGTSIYGSGYREPVTAEVFRIRNFELESLDIVSAKGASLQMGGEFTIVGETFNNTVREKQEGNPMPTETPVVTSTTEVREGGTDARVRELESKLAELRQYGSIMGQLRLVVGEQADIVAVVTEMHNTLTQLRERLQINGETSLLVVVEDLHTQVAESQRREFERAIDDEINALTAWNVVTESGKRQLSAFRSQMRRAALAESKPNTVKETLKRLWVDEFEILAEGVKRSLAGPGAFVQPKKDDPAVLEYRTEEQIKSLKEKWGVN